MSENTIETDCINRRMTSPSLPSCDVISRRQSLLLSEARQQESRRGSRVQSDENDQEFSDALRVFLQRERSRRRSTQIQLKHQLSVDMTQSRRNAYLTFSLLLVVVVVVVIASFYFKVFLM